MEGEGRVLPLSNGIKKKVEPVLTYVILLQNGKVIEQKATNWFEVSDDSGVGYAYHFYVEKQKVMMLEFEAVKAVLSKDDVDVEAAIAALCPPKRARKRKT